MAESYRRRRQTHQSDSVAVADVLSGASSGIGFRLQDARQFIQTDRMFVGLIELGILGALLDSVFVIISRRLVHWESA